MLQGDTMTHSPYLLFHQTPAQLRRVAARGGRASARNRRQKIRAAIAPPLSAVVPTEPPRRNHRSSPSRPWMRGFPGYAGPGSALDVPRSASRLQYLRRQYAAGGAARLNQQFIAVSRYIAIRWTSSSRI